jgi:hypothetical protein
MRIALEELGPRAIGTIGGFKPYLISRLDFKLPEDYNHSCPIFCTRPKAFQDNPERKTGAPGVCSNPIGYLSTKATY